MVSAFILDVVYGLEAWPPVHVLVLTSITSHVTVLGQSASSILKYSRAVAFVNSWWIMW